MNRFLGVVALVCAGLVGCVQKGTVHEKQAFTGGLSSYKTASVEVVVPDGAPNSARVKQQMVDAVVAKLRGASLFSDVPMAGGDMTVKVNVTNVDDGNKAAQALMGRGDAEVAATVELVDAHQSKVVGSFDVTGTSAEDSTTHLNGLNLKTVDDTTKTACGAAADQIAAYLAQHK
jgi:membrane-associated protease RseP (regulator of RpoE activity)